MRRNRGEIEFRHQLPSGNRSRLLQPSARPGEQSNQGFGRDAGLAQGTQASVAMTFGQAPAIGTNDQRHVSEPRLLQSKPTIEQQLPGRGRDEIIAPNDIGDMLRSVINDDGQLVSRRAGRFPNDEVAAVPGQRNPSTKLGESATRKRQAYGRSPKVAASATFRKAQVPGYGGSFPSPCGALAAWAMSALVQVQG
jgi:hypothetical protein